VSGRRNVIRLLTYVTLGLSAQHLAYVIASDINFLALYILIYATLLIKVFIVMRTHSHCNYAIEGVVKALTRFLFIIKHVI
jgi:hypothetical protein